MIENQQAWFGLARELGELLGTGMKSRGVALKIRPLCQPFLRQHFVNEDVAATAGINRSLRRSCIAGDDDAAVRRIETIAVAFHGVPGPECRNSNVGILVDYAR